MARIAFITRFDTREDQIKAREWMDMLKARGNTVDLYEHPKRFIKAYKKQPWPDLILTEVDFGIIHDGLLVNVSSILEQEVLQSIPVIAFSDYNYEEQNFSRRCLQEKDAGRLIYVYMKKSLYYKDGFQKKILPEVDKICPSVPVDKRAEAARRFFARHNK
ncbi:MAG: hypothetical protein P4M13_04120 [Alphaproteobacteria bacterium]|nr:hypothetical protein [Alphaproteobacteria bacterium]